MGASFVSTWILAASILMPSSSALVAVTSPSPVEVLLGRSVFIEPRRHLNVNFPHRSACQVVVLQADPLSQRMGYLVPDVFACNFSHGDVQYTHLGSKFTTEDFVRLQIRVDTDRDTLFVPFTLHVHSRFADMELVRKNHPLAVPQVGGLSSEIDADVLGFNYDENVQSCRVVILFHRNGVAPRFGELFNITRNKQSAAAGARYECREFLTAGVRYKHTKLNSSNRDHVQMFAERKDETTGVLKTENFQLIVRIMGARSNARPVASFQASHTLEVKQYAMAPITPHILAASDPEIDAEEIIFNVTQPLGPGQGHLVHTDDPDQRVSAFYQKDVGDLKIAYMPPVERSSEQRMFQVILKAVDDRGAASDPIMLLIMVRPTNVRAPVVTKNTGLSLFQGQSRALLDTANLAVSDKDNLRDVRLTVMGGLKHGELRILGKKVSSFLATDLELGVVRYHHDNSETYSDNVFFRMSDGLHSVDFLFAVTIGSIDDVAPVLVANTGLTLDEGGLVEIDQFVLRASDVDSDDRKIQFRTVRGSFSAVQNAVGLFCLRQRDFPAEAGWVLMDDGHYEKNVTHFFQEDITAGRLYYRHLGGELFREVIHFVLLDTADPPNVSPGQTFNVFVNRIDDLSPELYPGCALRLVAHEGAVTELSRASLRYTDRDSREEDLSFVVTREPFVVETNSSQNGGDIVILSTGAKVIKFTQMQVNHGKIGYQAADVELGLYPAHVQLEFSVSDMSGNTIANQVLRITVQPVNNRAPEVYSRTVNLTEEERVVIDDRYFTVYDEDTTRDQLRFTVTTLPRYGVFRRGDTPLTRLAAFTVDDVIWSRLSYEHVAPGEASDEVGLSVDDGVQRQAFLLQIVIFPKPKALASLTYNMQLKVAEHSRKAIRIPSLPGDSSPPLMLRMRSAPREGRVVRDGRPVSDVSVQDLKQGSVYYEHTGRETGLKEDYDLFNLTLSNQSDVWIMAGNQYKGVQVELVILPVDNVAPVIRVLPLTVAEGQTAQLTPRHVSVLDPDSRQSDVTCMIDVQPNVGFLENVAPSPGSEKSNAGKRIRSFRVEDVNLGNIYYVQGTHAGVEPKMDWLAFSCTDSTNTSPRYLMNIGILPRNDEKPEIFTREFVVEEGSDMTINLAVLNAMDIDVPMDELVFHVVSPPRHGVIEKSGRAVTRFSLTEIGKTESIVYQHDGSETVRDSATISVMDGSHNTSTIVPISIIPVDDEEPTMKVNLGLRLKSLGESKTISSRVLQAVDTDTPSNNLTFILRTPPRSGVLQLVLLNGSVVNLTQWSTFPQEAIASDRLRYTQEPSIPGGRDHVMFDVTDGINTLMNQPFVVEVEAGDHILPVVISKGVQLLQNTRIVLTTDFLSASDANSPNADLRYTVTKPPQRGRLVFIGAPAAPVTSFTQLDLAANRVAYVHSGGDEDPMDSFDFHVSDGTHSVQRTFLVTLLNVNNKRPVLIFANASVREGGRLRLTPFELRAEDQDTDDENVLFDVSRVPLHGVLLRDGSPVRSFSQADVNANRIAYVHDGSDTLTDGFRFTVRDGAHARFFVFPNTDSPTAAIQEFHIAIRPVDNQPPQLARNTGATSLHVLANGRLGLVLSGDILKAQDRDSDDARLVYSITSFPANGELLRDNASVMNFTQADLDLRRVLYVLESKSNATSDSFGFVVTDPAGNALEGQVFSLAWAWVFLERNVYDARETDGVLKVSLVRRGFLGHASFVRVSARGISAKARVDFSVAGAAHVQFSPGQSHAEWRLRIVDDVTYEARKTLALVLVEGRMCVIGRRASAVVTITDPEDVPRVEMRHTSLSVEEDCGKARIPLQRMGDLSQRLQVLCVTQSREEQGWATGASPTAVSSYSDFISRTGDKSSAVTFEAGETLQFCEVPVIDDTLYEDSEKFHVKLQSFDEIDVSPTRNTTQVIIAADPSDEPTISFERVQYEVDESVGRAEVTLRRTGSDLSKASSVFVRSRQSIPISARAGEDYQPLTTNVQFASHVTTQTVHVTILDDVSRPRIEGLERFELVLRVPVSTGLGTNDTAMISINDSFSDLPSVQFDQATYATKETAGVLSVMLMRSGDLSLQSSVRCYTRQMSARVGEDFVERPDSPESAVTFRPGQSTQICNVAVRDDSVYEGPEEFRLVLRSVVSDVRIGKKPQAVISISDKEDKPIIQFSQPSVFVSEPLVKNVMTEATVEIAKSGDQSKPSRVRVYTLDASAKAGIDYQPLTKILHFSGNVSRHKVSLQILFNADRRLRRVFTLHLTSDLHGGSELKRSKVVVYIDKASSNPAVTFPLHPRVVSLRHYDGIGEETYDVVKGYPVVCVTACNPKFPRYQETGSLCRSQGINDSLTQYRWQVALGRTPFKNLHDDTFFTGTEGVTLDGVYLSPGARVRCVARAVNSRGELGLESRSESVSVSTREGVCVSRDSDHVGSNRFVPSIAFTGSREDSLSNLVHIKVSIPHTDGLIPMISTKRFTNFRQTLGPGVLRVAQHKCSNLLDLEEAPARLGFTGQRAKDSHVQAEPYQHSAHLRGNRTLRFYQNLDLQSCMWTFNAYYDISEIVQYCGATVASKRPSRDSTQSQLTFHVPLYVSFVYRLSTAAGDWVHYDHSTSLRLTLTYDTAVLLKDGVQTLDGSMLSGDLWLTSITVRESDNRLVVRFKTRTKFRGTFLMQKAGTELKAMVVSRDRPRLSFELRLVTSEMTFDYPLQRWQFESNFAVRDYTGVYYVKLIPCTASEDVQYTEPAPCSPRDMITFSLPISFQQINDPVPAQFTLSAQFQLFSLKKRWLSVKDSAGGDGDIVFSKESKIFGRISLMEGDSLGRASPGYAVSVEKIYLCAGLGEYTPSYDPQNQKFGCLADEHYLIHRLKVLDKEEPNSIKTRIGNVPFEAIFASDDPDATPLRSRLDSDGFVINSAPLFEVPRDRKWFMHAVYSVTSKKKTTSQRSPRDTREPEADSRQTVIYELAKSAKKHVSRRDADTIEEIGNNGKGTNLKMIRLISEPADPSAKDMPTQLLREDAGSSGAHAQGLVNPLVIGIAVVCGVLLVALVVVGVALKRKLRTPPPQVAEANKQEVAIETSEGTRV